MIERNVLIATRVSGKGDTWLKLPVKEIEYYSLTDVLNPWFMDTKIKCEFRLDPLGGKLYQIVQEEEPEPKPKKYNIYGEDI